MTDTCKEKQELPEAIYVWLVPSAQVLEQPGSWRIRKWDTEPFPEANFTLHSATTAIAARRYSAGEITAAKFGELLGLEPGELQAFKVACGAYTESLLQPAVTARAVDHKEGKRPNKPMSLGEYERAALDGRSQREDEDYERRNDALNLLSGPGIRKT